MKDTFKRLFGGQPSAQAEITQEDVNMSVDVTPNAVSADASQETVVQLSAALEAVTSKLATAEAKIAELTSLVDAATEFKAHAEKQAAELKAKARKEKLEAAVGTAKAGAMLTATASLDDAAFDSIVAAMTTTLTVESNTPAFKEVGVEGEASKAGLDALAQSTKNVLDYLKTETAQ